VIDKIIRFIVIGKGRGRFLIAGSRFMVVPDATGGDDLWSLGRRTASIDQNTGGEAGWTGRRKRWISGILRFLGLSGFKEKAGDTHGFVGLRVYGFTGSWVHGFMSLRVVDLLIRLFVEEIQRFKIQDSKFKD
jgi:hypothetical protein